MKNKAWFVFIFIVLTGSLLFASEINFGGGYTKVSLQDGNKTVLLTDKAFARTEDVSLSADSIELYGNNYDTLKCKGSVVVEESKKGISVTCPLLIYNRSSQVLTADGWIEIDDIEHEVKLSCAWLEYNQKTSEMLLQIQAKIVKNTDSGIMTCSADSIEYNAEAQTVTLKGRASVVWGEDNYKASIITVNLQTEDVTLHGSLRER